VAGFRNRGIALRFVFYFFPRSSKILGAIPNLKRKLGVMFKTRKLRPDLAREAAITRGEKNSTQRTYTSTDVAKVAQVSLRQL
jgi:hypothetical protein